ncbi:hypothetical protein SAMN05660964_02819 [Thiothrix caldifontis]|uniref:MalT-like TPR region domain-containing protein n=1 Tax=Thiothrix caldifontis TaxID=525918 RepID=A0A1H4F5I3_9GAMM|nr:hypothetical protein [Thiothrix caldifontis]SEA91732.1 hypothetical protein SAMN05660964_02819 [Thiothrix caldifontis]
MLTAKPLHSDHVHRTWISTIRLNRAGTCLVSLGRLSEAKDVIQLAITQSLKQSYWGEVVVSAYALTDTLLNLGQCSSAIKNGFKCIAYSENSTEWFVKVASYVSIANVLHQTSNNLAALDYFEKAESIQFENQGVIYLYSIQGFYYCELLLTFGNTRLVKQRAMKTSKLGEGFYHNLSKSLDLLSLGKAWLQEKQFKQAAIWIHKSVSSLRLTNQSVFLPLGLLARAALHRHTRDFARAQQDLQEVFDIADGSGMRLHLTDYHLEMARLLIAEEENPPQSPFCKGGSQKAAGSAVPPFEKGGLGGISLQAHIEAAAKFINETGYHRRDKELLELQQAITKG